MRRDLIVSDCDESVLKLIGPITIFVNEIYRTSFTKEDYKTFNLWETWGVSREEAKKRVLEFFASDYSRKMVPFEGAQKVVNYLSREKDLAILTARPEGARQMLIEDINYYFGGNFSDFYFSNEWSNGGGLTKAEFCKKLSPNVLIEDSLRIAKSCSSIIPRILLLDRPWNRYSKDDLPDNVERVCGGWEEVGGILR